MYFATFLLPASITLHRVTTLFDQLPVNGHLGNVCFGVIVNNAAVDINVQSVGFSSLEYTSRNGSASWPGKFRINF